MKLVTFFVFVFLTANIYASGAKRPDLSESDVTTMEDFTPALETTEAHELVEEKYAYIDQDKVIPPSLLTTALNAYDANQKIIKNKDYLVVIDFKQHNSKKRFYLIDMVSGSVERYLTAHGKNSDPDFDGYATKFSNTPDSLMSSLGFYLTAETYYGENGYSLRLDGLSPTNSNARARAVVIHGASYVKDLPLIGRSYGCPALDEEYATQVIDTIKKGTLIYAAQ